MHYSIVKSPWLLGFFFFFVIIIYGIFYCVCINTTYNYKLNIFYIGYLNKN